MAFCEDFSGFVEQYLLVFIACAVMSQKKLSDLGIAGHHCRLFRRGVEVFFGVVKLVVGVGAFFGIVLAIANKKFAMEVNPLIPEVEDVLPKGQCGACGFAGCAKYAEAVVLDPDVPPNLCVPGRAEVAAKVAELTGKKAEETEPRYAHLKCRGTKTAKAAAYNYQGVPDCGAAKLLQGGPNACKFGCIGFGNCVRACPFGALSMGEDGLKELIVSIYGHRIIRPDAVLMLHTQILKNVGIE